MTDPTFSTGLLPAFLEDGGSCGALIAARDWSATLGPIEDWPRSLRTATAILLRSPVPMVLLWGEDGIMLYNDGYAGFSGRRHPELLGSKVREGWPEAAGFNDNVMRVGLAGGTLAYKDMELTLYRSGTAEQVFMNLDYSPVPDDDGRPAGVLAVVVETTGRVLAERHRAAEHGRLVKTYEQAPGIIAMLEGPRHVFVLANATYRELIGRRDVIGLPVREALPEVEDQGFVALLDRVYATGEPFRGVAAAIQIARVPGQAPEERFLDFIYQPVTDERGQVAGIFVEGYDVTERVRASRLLEAFVEAVPGVVFAKDREGRMLVANRGTADLIGRPPEAYIGRTDAEFLDDEAQALAIMETDRRIMESGVAEQVEEPVRLPDGTPATWLSTKAPLRDAEGKVMGLIGSSVDITARKVAEAALAESEERFRFALDAAGGIGTWDWDIVSDRVRTSDRFARMYGLDPERARTGLAAAEYMAGIHPEDRAGVGRLIEEALATGEEYRAEYRIQTRSGETRWVIARGRCLRDAGGRPVRFPGVTFDITDRKDVEARALESEARLRAVLDAAPVGLVFADAKGWVTGGNARVEEILGHPALPSRGVGEYRQWVSFHPDGRRVEGPEYPMARALAGEERPELDVHYERADGRRAWVKFIGSAMRDGKGAITGGVVASLDIDRERRAEADLRHLNETLEHRVAEAIAERERTEEQLRQSQKMEAVGQLTGGSRMTSTTCWRRSWARSTFWGGGSGTGMRGRGATWTRLWRGRGGQPRSPSGSWPSRASSP